MSASPAPPGAAAPDPRALVALAAEAAERAVELLVEGLRRPRVAVETKSTHTDMVSEMDRASERLIVSTLLAARPDDGVVGEEGSERAGTSGLRWVIDPLDGTTNYVQGLPIWCVSVACRERGRLVAAAILEPLAGNLYAGAAGMGVTWNGRAARVTDNRETGDAFLATGFPFRAHAALEPFLRVFQDVFLEVRAIRRCGAAALDLAHVAVGIYDGFFELRLSPWDVAAGTLLIEEAGGRVTDFDGGRDFLRSGNIVAATETLHPRLLELVRGHLSEDQVARLVPIAPPPVDPLL